MTVAVWVGYDNGDGKRRSLGGSATGARVALPIFEPIIQAVWSEGIAPKAPLSGPSPEAKRHLVDLPIDYASGQRVNGQGFIEHFRVGDDGRFNETQYQIVSPDSVEESRGGGWGTGSEGYWAGPRGDDGRAPGRNYFPAQGWQLQPVQPQQPSFFNQIFPRGLFTPRSQSDDPRNAVREQPEYLSNGRFN